jgi:Condensation domain
MRVDRKVGRGKPGPYPVPESAGELVYVFPVTSAQQRLWILDQLELNSTSYTAPSSIRMTGKLNAQALERTLNKIHETSANHHEVLRELPMCSSSARYSWAAYIPTLSRRNLP